MAESLGSLCDKLTIVKLKEYHTKNKDKIAVLQEQEIQIQQEINEFIFNAMKGAIPINKLAFKSNKIFKLQGNEISDIKGSIGEIFAKLAHANCELWHEQEKVYEFEKVPINEKDKVVKRLAILNLERTKCIDEIDTNLVNFITVKNNG